MAKIADVIKLKSGSIRLKEQPGKCKLGVKL